MTDTEKDTVAPEAPTTPEEAPAQPKINAVLVHRINQEDGGFSCVTETIGDVLPTEVEMVLEFGIQEYRSRIGLPKR